MKIFLVFILAVTLLSCSSVSYKSDFDKLTDFSKYKKYTWFAGEQPDDELSKNPLVKKRIHESVDKVLKQKGFSPVEEDDADFVVVIHGGTKERMQIYNTGGIGWYDPWWGAYGGRTDVSYSEEGTLIIDMVDAEKKELSGRGMATAATKNHSKTEDMQKYFDEVVEKTLEDFPPAK